MEPDINQRLFIAFIHAGHFIRAGRPSGAIPHDPEKCSPQHKHRFRRETILPLLLDHEGGMRQNQVAEEIHASPSTLSEMLTRLENDGYITRSPDPSDRRAAVLTLTESGTERATELKNEADSLFSQMFGKLSEDEKNTLTVLLEKLTDTKQASP